MAGVPVGYADTQQGAIAAATNFATVIAGPLVLHPDAYRAATQELAAPEAQDKLLARAESALGGLETRHHVISAAANGRAVGITTIPLSYHLDSFAPDRAAVSVWLLDMLGVDGVEAPFAVWATGTYDLVWSGGDWRLADDSSVDGPVIAEGQTPQAGTSLPSTLRDYKGYGYDPRN